MVGMLCYYVCHHWLDLKVIKIWAIGSNSRCISLNYLSYMDFRIVSSEQGMNDCTSLFEWDFVVSKRLCLFERISHISLISWTHCLNIWWEVGTVHTTACSSLSLSVSIWINKAMLQQIHKSATRGLWPHLKGRAKWLVSWVEGHTLGFGLDALLC